MVSHKEATFRDVFGLDGFSVEVVVVGEDPVL